MTSGSDPAVQYESIAQMGDMAGAIAAGHMADTFQKGCENPAGRPVEVTGNVCRVSTREPHPLANFVISDSPFDEGVIAAAVATLDDKSSPASVLLPSPPGASEQLVSALQEAGFIHAADLPAMAVEIASMATTSLPEGYEFGEISHDNADEWVDCFEKGYGLPPRVAAVFSPIYGDGSFRFFAATKEGRAHSVSMLYCSKGVAGIYCVATLPEARGKGLGAHMTAEPLRRAMADGYRVGVLQASEQGYPIYKKLGFDDVGSVQFYLRMPG